MRPFMNCYSIEIFKKMQNDIISTLLKGDSLAKSTRVTCHFCTEPYVNFEIFLQNTEYTDVTVPDFQAESSGAPVSNERVVMKCLDRNRALHLLILT